MRRSIPLALPALALLAASGALAQGGSMAQRPMQLRLLATPPAPFPDDGAVVFYADFAARAGNLDPATVRVVGPGMRPVAMALEELAPGLHRLAPVGGTLPVGRVRVEGLGLETVMLDVQALGATALPAPVVRGATRTHRTVRDGLRAQFRAGPVRVERVTIALASRPPRLAGIAARWTDWHDDEGGLYGAWAGVPASGLRVPLICSAEDDCGRVRGHLPRPRERGELRFVDDAGHLSPPSRPFRVR